MLGKSPSRLGDQRQPKTGTFDRGAHTSLQSGKVGRRCHTCHLVTQAPLTCTYAEQTHATAGIRSTHFNFCHSALHAPFHKRLDH